MDSITSRINAYNEGRNPEFLALKYQAMQESSFRFYRGTCHLFYEDLAKNITLNDPTRTWICGDLHLENFGSFKAGNGQVYFDVVDFDEAILAPLTWELMRTLTSIYLAVDTIKVSKKYADQLTKLFFETYKNVMLTGKAAAFERNTAPGLMRKFIRSVEKRKSSDMISDRTRLQKGVREIRIIKDRTTRINKESKDNLCHELAHWSSQRGYDKWKICDAAHRIAGTGSLGLDRFIILVKDTDLKKYFLLDMKQARSSGLSGRVDIAQHQWANHAERTVTIQNYMQNVAPSMLDVVPYDGASFVIKRLQPQADMMRLKLCTGKMQKLEEVIGAFAEISASAHLRASGRLGSDTIDQLIAFIHTYESWQGDLHAYCKSYAAQVKLDYRDFCQSR
jgi:uncharacterized protein (DUF2252 family)